MIQALSFLVGENLKKPFDPWPSSQFSQTLLAWELLISLVIFLLA